MDTWHIDTATLGPVMLRKAPTVVADAEGTIIPDRRTGAPMYVGDLLLPGVSGNRNGPTRPAQVRVKFVGNVPDGLADQQVVELSGKTTVTAWYRPSARRGDDAGSDITVSPEVMRPAPTGTMPTPASLRGLLPLLSPSATRSPFWLIDVYKPEGRDNFVALLSVPADVVDDTGTLEVELVNAVDIDLIGRYVQLGGIRGRILSPDRRDVGRNLKSELIISVSSITVDVPDLVGASNGAATSSSRSKPSPVDPAPEA